MLDFSTMLYRVPAILFAISIHEYAHAVVADKLGDPTARYAGRETFNPLAHLDVVGAILLVLVGFGWAKGVPINPNNFRNRKTGIMAVSFAGPAANLFLCLLAAFMMGAVQYFGLASQNLLRFLYWLQIYNVFFAFFNLLPIPPLDGSKILSELLPPDLSWKYDNFIGRYGIYILIAVCFTGISSAIITPLSNIYLFIVQSLVNIIF